MKGIMIAIGAMAMLISSIPIEEAVAGPESKCKSCHTFEQGGKHKTGPNLFAIVGRKAGSTDFGKYSDALKNADWVWDEEKLKQWVCDSKKAIKSFTGNDHAKTKMRKQKKCGKKAEAVVAFLKSLK